MEPHLTDPNFYTYRDETTDNIFSCRIIDGVLVRCEAKGCKCIELPKGIHKIARAAFFYNNDLEIIIVPEGVVEIENEAFLKCKSLKKIELPSTITAFSLGRQDEFESLEEIVLSADNPMFSHRPCPYVPE